MGAMQCPSCQAANPSGHKFCGACGHALAQPCPRCKANNPAHHKFCGECGASLVEAADLVLARSGLITQVNQKALDLLGYPQGEMQGKPFSLFVKRQELVVFFTHWNALLSQAKPQTFEIALNHKDKKSVHVRLACRAQGDPPRSIEAIHLCLEEITDRRLAAAQMQAQQELLGLTMALANQVGTADAANMAQVMEAALKKICLFSRADIGRIHSISRASNCLEPLYEWCHPAVTPPAGGDAFPNVPLARFKQTLVRLRQEKTVVVEDMAQLVAPEREEWRVWHPDAGGAAICHLVYAGAMPVGVFGVARRSTNGPWASESVSLIKFFGDLIADRLPAAPADPAGRPAGAPQSAPAAGRPRRASASHPSKAPKRTASTATRPLLLEKLPGRPAADPVTVFPRDDGLVLITCADCGIQEPVAMDQFEKLGKTLGVNCACGRQFAVVLEKRRFLRKAVRLDGYFSVGGDLGPIGADGTVWGTMVVKDLSRAGLRFTTAKAEMLHPGDLLMVRFNLDNANQALIHKPARVITVTRQGVGCRFEGADNYDITLGFYFM